MLTVSKSSTKLSTNKCHNKIISSPLADIGSIGVNMSYLDYSRQNEEQGIDYVTLSSGKFKDYTNPDRPLTLKRELY